MKKIFLTPAAFLFFISNLFSQVVINEIMYGPLSPNKEWFELHNTGTAPISIQNWKWRDAAQTNPVRTITTRNILLQPDSFVVICEDSVNLKNAYPLLNGIIVQSSGWNALNNSGNENIVIYNSASQIIDSLTYNGSWGGGNGFSLEKINPAGPANNSSNWGTSLSILKATPGEQNSLTPKPFDIFLKTFTITPAFPGKGDTLKMNFVIRNAGINTANNFTLKLYEDKNLDSIIQNAELVNSKFYSQLIVSDSLLSEFSIEKIDSGLKQFIAKIFYEQDNDTSNNILTKRIFVSGNTAGGGIVINEIMYDPLADQSEWIELYNAASIPVNLKGWKFKDAASSITLSVNDLNLNPGDYLILAHDSTLYNNFNYLKTPNQNRHIKFSNGLGLNNSGEKISITDSLNNLIDAVEYNPNWHNQNIIDAKGISLEKINYLFLSNEKSNWTSCAESFGGTPGMQNSIYTSIPSSNSTIFISPNPFSPDADGFEDFTVFKYRLKMNFASMNVKIFDVRGRLVRTIANNSVSGSEGTLIFDGYGNDNQKLRVGIYILLIEAIDDKGGIIDVIKAPVVVAGKL